jgi:hypothetical protein
MLLLRQLTAVPTATLLATVTTTADRAAVIPAVLFDASPLFVNHETSVAEIHDN